MTSELVISLDFELLWGMRDVADHNSYGRNILGGRKAIPRVLELFEKHGIRATWASVGFLFCASKEELLDALPPAHLRPAYSTPALSSYSYLDEVGADEASDPYYFGASLIDRIAQTPGQEVATHTLSHYYCLEQGQTDATFEADLQAAIALGQRRGIKLRSIVFPRNQYAGQHLAICHKHGIVAYRGNPSAWAYRPTAGTGQTLLRRGLRLADAHSGLLGHQTYTPASAVPGNVPASQFFRPCAGRLALLHQAHVHTVKAGLSQAAKTGSGYHLWWHPHNFGVNTDENLAALGKVIEHFVHLRDEHGMVSKTMADSVAAGAN
jgi:peptidoglycan/xylan/chitin deacetylase (PgdA/CDA1 family)